MDRARAWLAALALLALFAAPLMAAPKTAPRPVGPDGRAIYTYALIPNATPLTWLTLSDLGFVLEPGPKGELFAYLSPEEMDKLAALGIPWLVVPDPALEERSAGDAPGVDALTYHNHAELTAVLQQVASDHSDIVRLISAGDSVDGRELWWLKITDNPDVEEDEPGFKYISTMHGDEVVGVEMCLELIHWLTDGYASNSRAQRLVDNVEIWIMPMMNPDGQARSQRYNASGVDLNRNFPDKDHDPTNTGEGRAIETQRIMTWQTQHTTVLSANFHGGAVLTNYPYDGNPSSQSVYTATPDDDIFINLSLEYSEDNGPMYSSSSFSQGITNGADWYAISGGMQDWNYVWHGDMEVTVELSQQKWPAESTLDGYWSDNQESMISFLERALTGVRGVVTDADNGDPVAATLRIAGRDIDFYTDPEVGDYQRMLVAGSYTLEVDADGYESRSLPFTLTTAQAETEALRLDVALTPKATELSHVSARIEGDSDGDGHLEAGESAALVETLKNFGASATGIEGELVPLSTYASVNGDGRWPDLGAGDAAESETPHPTISAAANTPAGHSLAFATRWTTAEGKSGMTDAFFVPVGAPVSANESASDVPKAIPDPGTSESTLVVTTEGKLAEVNITVNIDHTYKGDVELTLIHPDGTTVRLHNRTGGSANDIITTYDTLTVPAESLDAFVGKPSAGTWRLRMQDHYGSDSGTLNSWSLELITRPYESPVSEVLLRDLTLTPEGHVRLDWWPVGSATSYKVHRSATPANQASYSDLSGADADTTDTRFVDATAGSFECYIVSGVGHAGEGLWGHYGR